MTSERVSSLTGTAKPSSLKKVRAQSKRMKNKVQECADELLVISEALAQEIDEHDRLKHELIEIRQKLSIIESILSDTQDVLATAHEVAEEAKRRTMRDFVTGIPNRELFNDRLEQALVLAKRCDWVLAVLFIDLDSFKSINDMHGHFVGDRVLQIVAKRLQELVRGEDTICRYGGDEFLYLLVNPQNNRNIQRIAHRVLDRISQPLIIDDLTLTIVPSIGIAVYPGDGGTGPELVANADSAMYQAKEKKAGYICFDNAKNISDGIKA
jgi:diguanylate cyclase (GGDEF)-like protein